jgi:uncharacterized membrane protein YfcA
MHADDAQNAGRIGANNVCEASKKEKQAPHRQPASAQRKRSALNGRDRDATSGGTLHETDLDRTVAIRGEAHTVAQALRRAATHAAYHVGQILYIARMLRPDHPSVADHSAWRQRGTRPGTLSEPSVRRYPMNVVEFTLLVWLGSMIAGFLGALTGLGGGVVIVPLLVLVFGVDLRYAMGASLVSVIATSSGAAAAYLREGYSNMRIGMFLEIATTVGALAGAWLAHEVGVSYLAIIFGTVLLISAYLSGRLHAEPVGDGTPDPIATQLRLDGGYPTPEGICHYHARNVPLGFAMMAVAGIISGLLGIGSGAFKVLAMDQAMRLPFKVSTTTSNFMIGVTAAASAGIYLRRGWIDPGLALPVMLGVLIGSMLGAKVLVVARVKVLRLVFGVVVVALGLQMIYKGMTGAL